MQSNDYQEVKRFIENNARYGYAHIDYFIVSVSFYRKIVFEKSNTLKPRIQIQKDIDRSSKIPKALFGFCGYGLVVSRGFTETYGVEIVKYHHEQDEAIQHLLAHNYTDVLELRKGNKSNFSF